MLIFRGEHSIDVKTDFGGPTGNRKKICAQPISPVLFPYLVFPFWRGYTMREIKEKNQSEPVKDVIFSTSPTKQREQCDQKLICKSLIGRFYRFVGFAPEWKLGKSPPLRLPPLPFYVTQRLWQHTRKLISKHERKVKWCDFNLILV